MTRLIVVNYEGDRFVTGNIQNINNNFFRDCGLYPDYILDQKNREYLFEYFQNYTLKSDKLLIHVKSHGLDEGICHLHPEIDNCGVKETLILWDELIHLFNMVSNNCNDLILNLGTVCNSVKINSCGVKMRFDVLVTRRTILDTVKPRKLNRELLLDIDNVLVDNDFELIRKK